MSDVTSQYAIFKDFYVQSSREAWGDIKYPQMMSNRELNRAIVKALPKFAAAYPEPKRDDMFGVVCLVAIAAVAIVATAGAAAAAAPGAASVSATAGASASVAAGGTAAAGASAAAAGTAAATTATAGAAATAGATATSSFLTAVKAGAGYVAKAAGAAKAFGVGGADKLEAVAGMMEKADPTFTGLSMGVVKDQLKQYGVRKMTEAQEGLVAERLKREQQIYAAKMRAEAALNARGKTMMPPTAGAVKSDNKAMMVAAATVAAAAVI